MGVQLCSSLLSTAPTLSSPVFFCYPILVRPLFKLCLPQSILSPFAFYHPRCQYLSALVIERLARQVPASIDAACQAPSVSQRVCVLVPGLEIFRSCVTYFNETRLFFQHFSLRLFITLICIPYKVLNLADANLTPAVRWWNFPY